MFLLWRPEWNETKNKWNKIPCNREGYAIDPHDAKNHLTYPQAKNIADNSEGKLFVGLDFSEADDRFFLDLDHQYVNGEWSDFAKFICEAFKGCYIEVSYSGDGLHIIGKYSWIAPHAVEITGIGGLYHTGRFCALTGNSAMGSMDFDATRPLETLINRFFPPRLSTAPVKWTTEPREDARPIEDDNELIQVALKSKSAAGIFGGATFKQLWEADESVLAQAYPPNTAGQSWDYSAADAALAQHLSFWTGANCERVKRLMEQSGLVRDKWERDDYLYRTITKVCARQKDVFVQKQEPQQLAGNQYLPGTQQVDHFRGCVYVTDLHRVLTREGVLLKPEQFNATYGNHTFALDTDRKTTTKAFEAFTNSQLNIFEQAQSTSFKPDRPFCEIIDGKVNVYQDPQTPRRAGDVTPFLNHLAKLLPVEQDRIILLSYLAACIQHKGVKFRWCPLIQGVEGNGKTLFTEILIEALGPRYAHMPKAKHIDSQFNGWLHNKLLIGVEDIYVPDKKIDLIEDLKPLITGRRQEIQFKGVDQITGDICANFILNSNHKDALKKTGNDRRFCPFFTAQQSYGKIIRDGMGGDYFPWLYGWLEDGGYAYVHEYLATWPIPPLWNPAGACHRAPVTSSTEEAIEASRSPLEARLQECIEDGVDGFTVNQVVFTAAELRCHGIRGANPTTIAKALNALGYVHKVRTMNNGQRTRVYSKEK